MYIVSCGVSLALTGCAKLVSATGHALVLKQPDTLLNIPNRAVLLGTGAVEFTLASYLLFSNRIFSQLACIGYLSICFIAYYVGVFWIGSERPCPCLGTVLQAIPIAPQTLHFAFRSLMGYMLLGSSWLMLVEWWNSKWRLRKTSS